MHQLYRESVRKQSELLSMPASSARRYTNPFTLLEELVEEGGFEGINAEIGADTVDVRRPLISLRNVA
jgi:hypothetical protein